MDEETGIQGREACNFTHIPIVCCGIGREEESDSKNGLQLTFYADLLINTFGASADLEFFSIIRIMRLFKLTQHSSGLKILMHTFKFLFLLFFIPQT